MGQTSSVSSSSSSFDVQDIKQLYDYGNNESYVGGSDDIIDSSYKDRSALLTKLVNILTKSLHLGYRPDSNSPDDLARFLKTYIPDPLHGNKKTFKSESSQHVSLVKKLAEEINSFYGSNVIPIEQFSGTINDTLLNSICSQIAEIIGVLGIGVQKELITVSANISKVVNNINSLRKLLNATHSKLATICKSDESLAMSNKSLFDLFDKELERQLNILTTLTGSVLTNTDKDLIALLTTNNEFKSLVTSLTAKLGSDDFSKKLGYLMSGIGNTTVMISKLDQAMKELGLKLSDYKSMPMSSIKSKATEHLASMADKLDKNKLDAYYKALDYVLATEGNRNYIISQISGAAEGDSKSYDDTMNEYLGGCDSCSTGGDSLSDRIKKTAGSQSRIVADFKEQSAVKFNNLIVSLSEIASHLGKSIYISDDIDYFIKTVINLKDATLNRDGLEYALSGANTSSNAIDQKAKFLGILSSMKMALQPLLSSPAKSYFEKLDYSIKSLVDLIESFNKINVSQVSDRTVGQYEGSGRVRHKRHHQHHSSDYKMHKSDIPDEKSLESIMLDEDIVTGSGESYKHIVDLHYAIQRIIHSYSVAKMLESMKQVASKIDEGEYRKYETLLGESMAKRIVEVEKECESLVAGIDKTSTDEFIRKHKGKIFLPDSSYSTDDIKSLVSEFCNARITLIKTVQAVDLILRRFREDVIRTPEAIKDIAKQLASVEVSSKWFNERTGNRLAGTYEFFPIKSDDVFDDLKVSQIKGDVLGQNDELLLGDHYYRVLSATKYQTGDPFTPVDPAYGKRIIKYNKLTHENLQALKNIISIFYNASFTTAKKEDKESFLSAIQIFNNLVYYLSVSCLTIGGIAENSVPGSLALPITSFEDRIAKVLVDMGNSSETSYIFTVKAAILYGYTEVNTAEIVGFAPAVASPANYAAIRTDSDAKKLNGLHNTIAWLKKLKEIVEQGPITTDGKKSEFAILLDQFVNINDAGGAVSIANAANILGASLKIGDYPYRRITTALAAVANAVNPGQFTNNEDTINRLGALYRLMLYKKHQYPQLAHDTNLTALTVALTAPIHNNIMEIAFNAWYNLAARRITSSIASDETKVDINVLPNTRAVIGTNILAGVTANDVRGPGIPETVAANMTLNQLILFLTNVYTELNADNPKASVASTSGSNKLVSHRLSYGVTMASVSDQTDEGKTVSGYKNIFRDEDELFIMTIKSMVSKILVPVEMYNYMNFYTKPSVSIIHPIRLILGADERTVEIYDEAIDLYIRLILLLEFYKKALAFESDSSQLSVKKISMAPEVTPKFTPLFRLVYEKMTYETQDIYTQQYTESLIKEINVLYLRYKSSGIRNITSQVISDIITEVNLRYGVMTNEEIKAYRDEEKKRLQSLVYTDQDNLTSYDLLDESKLGTGIAPSDKFGLFSSSSLSGTSKYDRKHKEMLRQFRDRIESALSAGNDGKDIINQGSFKGIGEQITLTRDSVKAASSYDEKLKIIITALQGVNILYKKAEDQYLMFHEVIVNPIMVLEMIRQKISAYYAQMESIDVTKVIAGLKRALEVKNIQTTIPSAVNPEDGKLIRDLVGILNNGGIATRALLTDADIKAAVDEYKDLPLNYNTNILRSVNYQFNGFNGELKAPTIAAEAAACKLDAILSSMNLIGCRVHADNTKLVTPNDLTAIIAATVGPTSIVTTANGFSSAAAGGGNWTIADAKMIHDDNMHMFISLIINWDRVLQQAIEYTFAFTSGINNLAEFRIQARTPVVDFTNLREYINTVFGYVRKQFDVFRSIIDKETLQKYESTSFVSISTLQKDLIDKYLTSLNTPLDNVNRILKGITEWLLKPLPRKLSAYTYRPVGIIPNKNNLMIGHKATNLYIPVELVFSDLVYYNPLSASLNAHARWGNADHVPMNSDGFLNAIGYTQLSSDKSVNSLLLKSYNGDKSAPLLQYSIRHKLYADDFYLDSMKAATRKNGRGIMIKLNETLFDYLNTLFDKTTNKIYLPLIKFADGAISAAVMKGYAFPDVVTGNISYGNTSYGNLSNEVYRTRMLQGTGFTNNTSFVENTARRLVYGADVKAFNKDSTNDEVRDAFNMIKQSGIDTKLITGFLGLRNNLHGNTDDFNDFQRLDATEAKFLQDNIKGCLVTDNIQDIKTVHSLYFSLSRYPEFKFEPFEAGWQKRHPLFIGFIDPFQLPLRRGAFLLMKIGVYNLNTLEAALNTTIGIVVGNYALDQEVEFFSNTASAEFTRIMTRAVGAGGYASHDVKRTEMREQLLETTFKQVYDNNRTLKLASLTLNHSYAQLYIALMNEIENRPSITAIEVINLLQSSTLWTNYQATVHGGNNIAAPIAGDLTQFQDSYDNTKAALLGAAGKQNLLTYQVFDNVIKNFNADPNSSYNELRMDKLPQLVRLMFNASMTMSTGELWLSVVNNNASNYATELNNLDDMYKDVTGGAPAYNFVGFVYRGNKTQVTADIGTIDIKYYQFTENKTVVNTKFLPNDAKATGGATTMNRNICGTIYSNHIMPYFFVYQGINKHRLTSYIRETKTSTSTGNNSITIMAIDAKYTDFTEVNAYDLTQDYICLSVCRYVRMLLATSNVLSHTVAINSIAMKHQIALFSPENLANSSPAIGTLARAVAGAVAGATVDNLRTFYPFLQEYLKSVIDRQRADLKQIAAETKLHNSLLGNNSLFRNASVEVNGDIKLSSRLVNAAAEDLKNVMSTYDTFSNVYKSEIERYANSFNRRFTGDDSEEPTSMDIGTIDTKFGDPNNVIFASIARALRTAITTLDSKGNKKFLLESMSDIPQRMKELYRANLPAFNERFKMIMKKLNDLKAWMRLLNENAYRASIFDAKIAKLDRVDDIHSGYEQYVAKNKTETHTLYSKLFEEMKITCESIIGCISRVRAELDDNPMYLETHENSISDYKMASGKLPLTPLSLTTYLFRGEILPQNNANPSSEFPLIWGQQLESTEFKFEYGVRKLLMDSSSSITIESAPFMAELLNKYNAIAPLARRLDVDAYNKFFTTMVELMRWITGTCLFSAVFTDNITRFNNNSFTDTTDDRKHILPISKSDMIDIITGVDYSASIKQLTSKLGATNNSGYNNRSVLLAANIIEMNKMPIDVNALAREIPLNYLYNFALTFDSIINNSLGVTTHDTISSEKQMFAALLRNPFRSVSETEFFNHVQRLMEGRSRPLKNYRSKFADELWNKPLFQTTLPGLTMSDGTRLITSDITDRATAIAFYNRQMMVYPTKDSKGFSEADVGSQTAKEYLVDTGRRRYDTTYIRKIAFINDAFRILREQIFLELIEGSKTPILDGISIIRPELTDLRSDETAAAVDELDQY